MLHHKGYTGHAEFDDEARLFHGEEPEEAFQDSVDDYLEFCGERGEAAAGR